MWQGADIMKLFMLFIMPLSPASCYFLLFRSKYLPITAHKNFTLHSSIHVTDQPLLPT